MKNMIITASLLFAAMFSIAAQIQGQENGAALQAAAEAAYDRGYTAEKPADQALAFDEAAGLFERAAKAYLAEGDQEKAKSAEHMAGLARQNAEHRRKMAENAFFGPMGGLTGPGYKLYSPPGAHVYFLPEAGITYSKGDGLSSYDGGGIEQLHHSIYSDPALLEQLFEKLGGEFFIGTFSAPASLEDFRQERGLYKGISGGLLLSPRWQVEGSLGFHQSRITARFPLTAFSPETYEPYSLEGKVSTETTYTEAGLGAAYNFAAGAVRPFAGLGLHYSGARPGVTQAHIAGVAIDMEQQEAFHAFGPYLSGGLSWNPAGPLLLRVSGKAFGAKAAPSEKNSLTGMLAIGLGLLL